MATRLYLPDHLQSQMEAAAHSDGKTVSELMQEATERYLSHRELDRLMERGRQYAGKKNHTVADVPRLVREIRSPHGL